MNISNLTNVNRGGCTACSACLHRCPKHCITMREDGEGFLYPEIAGESCIDCGLCVKVCPIQHPFEERMPRAVLAAINKDEATRLASSSGGIFHLLAEKAIAGGGVVFGARFDADWQVCITHAETLEEAKPFMGSKYVQARTGRAYKDAERFLKAGRQVLFSGTPCQVAGLMHFLGEDYDNLTTVDFVCHGVPSPKVWRRYLDEVATAARRVGDIHFRNKRDGWKRFDFSLSYQEQDKTISLRSFHGENHYMRAFLSDMALRPSCHHCQAKCGRSHSDITLADYWGVEQEHPDMDDDKGTGLVLVNTERGKAALDWAKTRCQPSTYAQALRHNPALRHSAKPHPKRTAFFARLDATASVTALIDTMLRPTFKQRIKDLLRRCKHLAKRMFENIIGGGKFHELSHATPSPSLPPAISLTDTRIATITFRDKRKGWKGYGMRIDME